MRSGGPKLFCSPYFSIGSVVVLLIVIVKYYNLSSEHENLLLKVSVLQNQMKLTASNMRNLDTSLSRKEEAFTECLGEKSALEEKNKKLQSDNFNQANDIADLQKLNMEATELVKNLQSNNEKLNQDNNTMMEELKYLKRRNEELTHVEEECRANEGKINQLQGELNTLQEKNNQMHIRSEQIEKVKTKLLPEGELQDINPGAVHIIQPALNGTNGAYGHGVPVLPRGDPNAEKPQPRLNLDLPLTNDKQVREDIIAEEEAKEELKVEANNPPMENGNRDRVDDIHDFANAILPPKNQEEFYRKKAKFGIKSATETLLDLNKLNRDQQHEDMGIIEETAVLKQPLDLEKIQRNNVQNKNELIEEPPKEYDEQELPGPQDKRDPAVLLKDPRARDQDDDSRIVDAVEHGFGKKGRWRHHF